MQHTLKWIGKAPLLLSLLPILLHFVLVCYQYMQSIQVIEFSVNVGLNI